RVGADRFCDLDDLLLRHAKCRDQPFSMNRASDTFDQITCPTIPLLPVHLSPDASAFERQRDVFCDAEMRKQRRLLVDGGDTKGSRNTRIITCQLAAADR